MRVLFTTSPWTGHWFCMVPVGWALQAARHEVRVACAPSQQEAVAQAGLVPVPVLDGGDVLQAARMVRYEEAVERGTTQHGLPLHPFTGRQVGRLDEFDLRRNQLTFWPKYGAGVRRSHDAAVELARQWRPDLVLHDIMSPEGALAARVTGVAAAQCAPGLFGSLETDPGLSVGPDDMTGSFPRYGQPAWTRAQIEYVIDPSPPSALPPIGSALRLPVSYVPYNGPGGLPDWARERAAATSRVCVIWGHSATGQYGPDVPSLRYAIDAAAALAGEVLLTASPAQIDALGTLRANVRVLRSFPLHLLLETCDAVVHHGSDNCIMTAAAAGVPQVSLALSDDQVIFNERIEPAGSVVALRGLLATAAEVRAGVADVLSGAGRRAAAAALRAELAAYPTPAELVGSLARLASDGRLAPPTKLGPAAERGVGAVSGDHAGG